MLLTKSPYQYVIFSYLKFTIMPNHSWPIVAYVYVITNLFLSLLVLSFQFGDLQVSILHVVACQLPNGKQNFMFGRQE